VSSLIRQILLWSLECVNGGRGKGNLRLAVLGLRLGIVFEITVVTGFFPLVVR
jgi:hypothetical protein